MIYTRRVRQPRQYRLSAGRSTLALTGDRAKRVAAALLAVAGTTPDTKNLRSGSLSSYASQVRKMLPR